MTTENVPGGQAGEASVRDQAEGAEQPETASPQTVSPQVEGSGPRATQDPAEGSPEAGPDSGSA